MGNFDVEKTIVVPDTGGVPGTGRYGRRRYGRGRRY